MILARRMCANEPQELEKIETTFLSHRSELNPVMTLLSVANGQPAPVLVNSFCLVVVIYLFNVLSAIDFKLLNDFFTMYVIN